MSNGIGKDILVAVISALAGGVVTYVVGVQTYRVTEKESVEKSVVKAISERYEDVEQTDDMEDALEKVYKLTESQLGEIDRQNSEISQDEATISDLSAQINSLNAEVNSSEEQEKLTNEINNYIDTGDYEMAIAALNGIKNKTDEMKVTEERVQALYETTICSNADSFVAQNKYDEAEAEVNKGLALLPDSETLKQKLEDVKDSAPQLLFNIMKPYQTKSYEEVGSGYNIQMNGKDYSNGFVLTAWQGSYASFNLEGKYSKLTFIAGHVDGTGNGGAPISVFGDNNVLLKEIEVRYDLNAAEYSIDVTGVSILKFTKGLSDDHPGIMEIKVQK